MHSTCSIKKQFHSSLQNKNDMYIINAILIKFGHAKLIKPTLLTCSHPCIYSLHSVRLHKHIYKINNNKKSYFTLKLGHLTCRLGLFLFLSHAVQPIRKRRGRVERSDAQDVTDSGVVQSRSAPSFKRTNGGALRANPFPGAAEWAEPAPEVPPPDQSLGCAKAAVSVCLIHHFE